MKNTHAINRKVTFALLGLVPLALSAWFAMHDSEKPASEHAGAVQLGASDPAVAAPRPYEVAALPASQSGSERDASCNFEQGQKLSYALESTVRGTLSSKLVGGVAQSAGQLQKVSLRTAATLDLEVLATNVSGAVLLARYRNFFSQGQVPAAEVERPFLLKLAPSCEISGFASERVTLKAVARAQQALAHELWWRFAPEEGASIQGSNGAGSFDARVSVDASNPMGATLTRTIDAYSELWSDDLDLDPVPEVSELRVRLGSGPWFEALAGREVVRSAEGGATALERTVHAQRDGVSEVHFPEAARVLSRYRWHNLLPETVSIRQARPVTLADQRARDRVRLQTPEQAVDGLIARTQGAAGVAETWPDLTHYLEARPDATPDVVRRLAEDGELSEQTIMSLYMALSRARTPEAKDVLLAIMNEPGAPPPDRVNAMFALIDRDDVGLELASSLEGLARSARQGDSAGRYVGKHALLALGAMSGMQLDDEISGLARAAVLSAIDSPNRAVQRAAFGAFANLGEPALLGAVQRATRSPDEHVRRAAAIAVRRMPPAQSHAFVAAWLAHESSWRVKFEIYSTLERQMHDFSDAQPGTDLLAHALADLASQPGVLTRRALLNIVGRAASDVPEARVALMRQIPTEIEERSGLFDTIIKHLSPEDVREALR